MNRTLLKASLVKHEGLRRTAYRDTADKLTIGVGRNIEAVGLSDDEIQLMLDNDINRAFEFCQTHIDCFGSLDSVRQNVLVEMAFNLGGAGLAHFTKMLAALEKRDFAAAAEAMLASEWAKQVGQRATNLASAMRMG